MPWRDIWSAGQGIGAIEAVRPVAQIADDLKRGFAALEAG